MARGDELRALQQRWREPGPKVVGAVRAELRAGVGRVASPFGDFNGRSDFRGVRLNRGDFRRRTTVGEKRSGGSAPARGTFWSHWEAMDFTGADLAEMNWTQHHADDCVFDDADLTGLRCWGVTITHCSFRRARLYHAQLGPGPEFWGNPSEWIRVDFRQADLRGLLATSVFAEADFRNAKFRASALGWSTLRDCRFSGVVNGLSVGARNTPAPPGWHMRSVDLRQAKPRDFLLHRVDLGQPHVDLQLPQDENHWIVADWPRVLDRVGQAIAAMPEGDERLVAGIWLDHQRRDLGPEQTLGFVAAWDLERLGSESLVRLLNEARH